MTAVEVGTAAISPARAPLLGRRYELAEMRTALDRARAGEGRLFLLSGDAGIGKTRLAEALADEAEPTDARVRWGSCWEGGGAPPYWPWSQVLAAELADLEDHQIAAFPQAVVSHLAHLVPDLTRRFTEVVPPRPDVPAARAALFEAVSTFLRTRSGEGGLVLILDDLHAADTASLRLLQVLARDLASSHLLVVGTYRDPEVRSSPALHQLMSALGRLGRRMTLPGLDEDHVADLLERATGSSRLAQLAKVVHHTTDGNPFFVQEVGRVLVSERHLEDGSATLRVPVPEEVHALIRRRLEPVEDDLRHALTVAAVLGRTFDVAALAAVLDRPIGAVLDLLGQGQRLDVIEDAGLDRFQFSHALLAEAMYDELRPSERVSMHRRAGEVLEHRQATAAQLAHHFYNAARDGNGAPAVRWCTEAGRQAMDALAFEEAGAFYGRALEAVALSPPVDERQRYELLTALAEARKAAGDLPVARETYQRALKSARALGSPELLARAAIGYAGYVESAVDDTRASVIEEALAALPATESPLRARLLVLLAHRLQLQRWATPEARQRAAQRSQQLGRQGVEMARRLGDPETLRAALWEWHFTKTLSVDALDERLAVADELVQLALAAGDRERLVLARQWRAFDLYVLGDIRATEVEIDTAAREADALRMPFLVWGVAIEQAGLALLRGQLEEAEAHARRALAHGERAEFQDAEGAFANQLRQLHWHRGQWRELEQLLRVLLERHGSDAPDCMRISFGLVAAYRGEREEARRLLAETVSHLDDPVAPTPICLSHFAELAWMVDATDGAERAYELLSGRAGLHLVIGVANASRGSADRYLGQLATLLGRLDEADRHFQDAHRLHARLGSPVWDAYTLADHARMLLRRGEDGDREMAAETAEMARRRFRELGMTWHEQHVDVLLGAQSASAADPARVAPVKAATDSARLSQEGEYWAFEYGGGVARLRDSKGLRYLAHLLRNPGREHHALDLVVGDGGRAPGPAKGKLVREPELTRIGSGDAGAVLDAKAKNAYRARVQELREEVDEATARHDLGRAERAQTELDFLLAELAAAVGLGGRDRRAASDAEKARQSVTRAIKGAVERVGEAHPVLGEHLRSTVRTGIYSSYSPDPRAPITWDG